MISNTGKPRIQTTFVPFLVVKDGTRTIEFYTTGLGAVERVRYELPGGKVITARR